MQIGTHGRIWVKDLTPEAAGTKKDPKTFEARTRFRMGDGTYKQVLRWRSSKTAASNAVEEACAKLAEQIARGEVGAEPKFRVVAEAWLAGLERDLTKGVGSHGTVRTYRGSLDNNVLPFIGELRFGTRELTGTVLDNLVKERHDTVGYATARTVRAVLRGCCAYAVRHHITSINLAGSISRLVQGEAKEIVALTLAQRKALIAGLAKVAEAHKVDKRGRSLGPRAKVWSDLPDLVEAMLSTGMRLGELLALVGPNFGRNDSGDPVLRIEAHVVRENGELVRKAYRKGSKKILVLGVPGWSVPMWQRRKLAAGFGSMWSAVGGGLIHPDNLGHRLREAFDEAGFDWVTSHVFRKTVASVLDEAGLPTRAIADQLGHANEATARAHYVAPRAGNEAAVTALEGMV